METPIVMGDSHCGAAFVLSRTATSHAEALPNGWTVDVASGSAQLVVRGPGGVTAYEDAFVGALDRAQQALDLLSIRGGAALSLERVDTEHVVWWTSDTGQRHLRVVAVADLRISMSVTATVVDAAGNVRTSPPPPEPRWHESLRYFRLAQVTEDLFDAYRNMYLAFEALLSAVEPPLLRSNGKPAEREGEWLRRALQAIDGVVALGAHAPPGAAVAVERVFDDLYTGTRTRLFHAKAGRTVLLPHGLQERDAVMASLRRLSGLFLDLWTSHTGHRRPSGAMTHAGFEMATAAFELGAVVSDDAAPEAKDDVAVNPTSGRVATLHTERSDDLSRPGLTFWLGEIHRSSDVPPGMSKVRRAGLVAADGTLVQLHRLVEPVDLSGVDVLQVQMGARLVNAQQPRFRFTT
jgi:hypothetical protein